MRGADVHQEGLFSYLSPESRILRRHPLRPIRTMVDRALGELCGQFEAMYAVAGRPSIPPEKLPRALLLQIFYSIRSERMLCEQLDYNLLFRWFIGLLMDDCGVGSLDLFPRTATGCWDRTLRGSFSMPCWPRRRVRA